MGRAAGEPQGAGICFLIEDFHPVVHGASSQILEVCERLERRGVPATVVTRRIESGHARVERHRGATIRRVRPVVGLHRLGKYLMMLPAFLVLVRRRRDYALLVVCDFKALGFVGLAASRALGKRCVFRAESCGELDGSYAVDAEGGGTPGRVLRALLALRTRLLARADRFVAISSATRAEFLRCGIPEARIVDITNGIDTRRFAPAAPEEREALRRRLGLPEGRRFVYTGRLTASKGLPALIEAWHALVAERDDVRLVLVGSGQGYASSIEDALRARVRERGLTGSVVFTGAVADVPAYLRACDFFAFPTETEALGLSLVEALGCGLPAVAARVGGIPDVAEDGVHALLVPPRDPAALGRAMRRLLDEPALAAGLAERGRARVQERFDVDRIASAYAELLPGSGAEARPLPAGGPASAGRTGRR